MKHKIKIWKRYFVHSVHMLKIKILSNKSTSCLNTHGIHKLLHYIHVTLHRNRFLFKYPTRRTNYSNLFFYKTLYVSGIFCAHHQEFSTVNSALVSFMQVFDDRFQVESGWNCFPSWLCVDTVIKNLHETYHCRIYSRKLLMMGREDARNM